MISYALLTIGFILTNKYLLVDHRGIPQISYTTAHVTLFITGVFVKYISSYQHKRVTEIPEKVTIQLVQFQETIKNAHFDLIEVSSVRSRCSYESATPKNMSDRKY